ncbi:MAG: hypothetical protein V7607_4039 [Solirubrobacteraceae bacterium]
MSGQNGHDPTRCVVIVDEALPPGLAANAAAMVALTLGATVEGLPGADLVDADGNTHPGLIPSGIPILAASREQLSDLHARAERNGVGVVDFPAFGQQTTDYESVIERIGQTPAAELEYLGVALHGPRRAVRRLTGHLRLLR